MKIYKNLWKIEDSFRHLKSCIRARPVYVRLENHIRGHFLICFLALCLHRFLEYKLQKENKKATTDQIIDGLNNALIALINPAKGIEFYGTSGFNTVVRHYEYSGANSSSHLWGGRIVEEEDEAVLRRQRPVRLYYNKLRNQKIVDTRTGGGLKPPPCCLGIETGSNGFNFSLGRASNGSRSWNIFYENLTIPIALGMPSLIASDIVFILDKPHNRS